MAERFRNKFIKVALPLKATNRGALGAVSVRVADIVGDETLAPVCAAEWCASAKATSELDREAHLPDGKPLAEAGTTR